MPMLPVDPRMPAALQVALTAGYALFPDDERLAQLYATRNALPDRLAGIGPDELVPVPAKLLGWMIDGNMNARIDRESKRRASEGATAGGALILMHAMAALGIEPSIQRASQALSELSPTAKTRMRAYWGAVNLLTDPGDIRKAWKKMKPVAHLHASIAQLAQSGNGVIDSDAQRAWISQVGALATGWLEFGESHRAMRSRAKSSLLSAGESWCFPQAYGARSVPVADVPDPLTNPPNLIVTPCMHTKDEA